MMSANEKSITYSGIKSMNKTEYYKMFKKPAVWKKAQAMICITKHKFTNGKVPLVCIPFRKKTEAAKVFKQEVKKDLSPKFMLLAAVKIIKQEDGKPAIEITPIKGAANIEAAAPTLFEKMKLNVVMKGKAATDVDTEPDVEISSATGNAADSSPHPQQDPDKELKQEMIKEFQKQMKALNPEMQKLTKIVANLKSKKVTAKDIESANDIRDKILEAIIQYEQLDESSKKTFAGAYKQLQSAETKVEKINDAAMFMESEDEAILEKQRASLEKEMKSILAKYGVKLDF